MIRCDTCPRCRDEYPGRLDRNGYHFHICGMSGNKVYTTPRKEKRYSGPGYIKFGICSCGIYNTIDDALASMTEAEKREYYKRQHASGA